MLKKGDLLLGIVLAMLIAASFYGIKAYKLFLRNTGHVALIVRDGKVLRSVNLDSVTAPETIKVAGEYEHIIFVEPGRIRFLEADCPNKTCIRTGWLKDAGETAACIPDKMIIKVQGQRKGIDAVSY